MSEIKLSQVVVLATGLARRKAVELIKNGFVKVNNEISLEYSRLINYQIDKVQIQGYKFSLLDLEEQNTDKHYFIYYKPKGIEVSLREVSKRDEPRNSKSNTLNKVIIEIGILNLKPVGRLDLDSEGLLLLSNDGDFINKLTHPKYHVPKIYKVWVNGLKDLSNNSEQIKFLRNSFKLGSIEEDGNFAILEVELQEGKNRQIRRICAQAGLYVKRILRISIGEVKLNKLKPGDWKPLSNQLIQSLFKTPAFNKKLIHKAITVINMQEVKIVPASVKAFLSKIGNQLKIAREEQGLSREDVCRALKMHINFLIALEEGLFEDLPGAASFFASLRSYSRLLKLDADKIVEECKKNKYLFESFQGYGLIERNSKPDILHQSSNIIRSSPTSLPPVEIPNISRGESNKKNNSFQVGEESLGGEISNSSQPQSSESAENGSGDGTNNWQNSNKAKSSGQNAKSSKNSLRSLVLSGAIFLIVFFALLFLPIPQLKDIQDSIKSSVLTQPSSLDLNSTESMNSNDGELMDLSAASSAKSPICGPFKLSMEQAALVEVYGMSGGQVVLPQRIVQEGEELEFSDSRGIKIYTSSPDESILRYKGRKQDLLQDREAR